MKHLCWICVSGMIVAGSYALAESFKDTKGKYLDILHDGKPIVRYMYEHDTSTDEKKLETCKVYYNVMNEDGTDRITKGAGHLYPHHRGIFIGWMKVKSGGKIHDLWHMKKGEAQVHKEILEQKSDKDKTILLTRIEWLRMDGETPCIDEKRKVTVYHNDTEAHLLLDFETELKAVNGDVELSGDPEHAGFQYRAHESVEKSKSVRYTFPEPGTNPKKTTDMPWAAMTYRLAGKVYTVQHMTHPDNPKGWKYSAYRKYGRYGAFFETSIKDGETVKLKYRIRITTGEKPDLEALAAQYEKFSG